MRLLYKTYACEAHEDGNKILYPGYPVPGETETPKNGSRLHVELADGTRLQTTVVGTQYVSFAPPAADRLRAKSGFYCAVKVPKDFDVPGVELGANVYVED